MKLAIVFLIAIAGTATLESPTALGEQWTVPLAGNTFRTQPAPGATGFQRGRMLRLGQVDEVFSVYFHVDRPGLISLSVRGRGLNGASKIQAAVGAEKRAIRLSDRMRCRSIPWATSMSLTRIRPGRFAPRSDRRICVGRTVGVARCVERRQPDAGFRQEQ